MLHKAFLTCCLSLLLVYVPVAPAATPAVLGQVTIKGTAEINGAPAPSVTTLFAGDRIATQKNTAAQLALPGGNEVLLPSSSAAEVSRVKGRTHVNLKQGSLAVLSQSRTPVVIEANGARILPAAGVPAVVEVAVDGRALNVVARRGSATVETANRTVQVKEGTTLRAMMAAQQPMPAGETSGLSTLDTAAIVIGVGAGLAGLGLGIAAITRANPADCKIVSPSGTLTLSCP